MRQVYEKDGILHVHSRFWHRAMPIMVTNSNIKGGPELYTNHPSYATWKPTRWFDGDGNDLFECDICHEINPASHFCPECGAFMTIEGEEDEENDQS